MIGRTLGHYRIESKLGEGGMGVVYQAHDTRVNRRVAIKVLPPERVADPVLTQRFTQEARAAGALNHPNIVTIHDIQSDAGINFIVMEYIEGQTFAELIPSTGLPVLQVVRYGVQIADALARAHAAGIIHRDLKPSNLMLTMDGRVKILDFGLAKLLETAATDHATTVAALTEVHAVLGTAAYMSPEQAEGHKLDARSDIFSFGALLYEMVTGRRPFASDSRLALLSKIVHHDPQPPHEIVPSIPADLERVILRCLRKEPARRYQSMADLKVVLEDLQTELASGATIGDAARRHSRGRRMVTVAAVAAVATLGAVAILWLKRPVEPVEPLNAEALTTLPGEELYPALSPDGKHVAFTWNGPRRDNTDVYVQQIGAAGSPLRLTDDPRTDYNPVWAPDGRWIAFLRGQTATPLGRSEREVRLIAPLGGSERKIADIRVQEITVNPVFLTWCPDSTCLLVTDTAGEGKPDSLFVVSLDTADKRPLTSPAAPVLADTNPSLSPDGKSLLFLRRSTWGFGDLYVLPVGRGMTPGGEPRHIRASGVNFDCAAWVPDGTAIVASTPAFAGVTSLWRLPADGSRPPARLPFVGEDGVMPAFAPARSNSQPPLVYVRSSIDTNIWRIDSAGPGTLAEAAPVMAVASTKQDIHPRLSPDGRRIAFTSTRSGAWELWVSNLDGSDPLQLTSLNAPTGTGAPQWSPDGQQVVFASDAEGQFEIYVVPSSGGKPRNLSAHPAIDHVPSFSRDGRSIYYSSSRSGRFEVWRMPAAGGAPVQITRHGGWLSEESPDGSSLFFMPTSAIGAPTALWKVGVTGGEASKVLDGVLNLPFMVSDRGVYYLDMPASEPRLQFFDLVTRRATTVVRSLGFTSGSGYSSADLGFHVSADGRVIVFGRQDSSIDDLMLVRNFR